MNSHRPLGLYLYKKESQDRKVLKDLLRFLRTNTPGKSQSFSYIEAETSLHPNLSLWENLQIELGSPNWSEFHHALKPEWAALVNLLKRPDLKAQDATIWEKFLVSLLKGLMIPSKNLLIDMNEELLSPFLIQSFKKSMIEATKDKTVYLASANSSLWLDCAHTLVDSNEYTFNVQSLNSDHIKKHWAA
jgi:ABC-type branched-subunit amino acid transport system ATPase component